MLVRATELPFLVRFLSKRVCREVLRFLLEHKLIGKATE